MYSRRLYWGTDAVRYTTVRWTMALGVLCAVRPVSAGEVTAPEPDMPPSEVTNGDVQPTPPLNSDRTEKESSPCDGVTCSNHGRCVTVRDAPTCACYEGYAPDTVNGLSCVPVAVARDRRPGSYGLQNSNIEDAASLSIALDGYDLSELQASWHKEGGRRKLTDYLIDHFNKKKGAGAGLIFIGVLLCGGSAGLYVAGAKKEEPGLTVTGSVFDIFGTVMVITGIVKVSVNSGRVKRLRRYQAAHRLESWRFEHFGPWGLEKGAPKGYELWRVGPFCAVWRTDPVSEWPMVWPRVVVAFHTQ